MRSGYFHGYKEAESRRLSDQASTLEDRLHHDTVYAPRSAVLEAGYGGGAQTVPLLRNSPDVRLTYVDLSANFLARAELRVRAAGLQLPAFRHGNLTALPFPNACFDYVFVCFVLEHLPDPTAALGELRRC